MCLSSDTRIGSPVRTTGVTRKSPTAGRLRPNRPPSKSISRTRRRSESFPNACWSRRRPGRSGDIPYTKRKIRAVSLQSYWNILENLTDYVGYAQTNLGDRSIFLCAHIITSFTSYA